MKVMHNPFRDESDLNVGIRPSYTNKIAEPGVTEVINTNRVLIEPFSNTVDEALLEYSQTEMNNGETIEQIENQEMRNICLNETFDQSTQKNITIDLSIPQPYSLVSDDEVNSNIQSLNVQQRQVFDFVYSWAKETVKQKSSVKPNLVKPFNLFLSGSSGVGKSHLIKTIYQSVPKVLQYHGGSPDKPRILILAPTDVASINVNGIAIHSALSIPCRGKFYPLDCNSITSLRNKF